MIRTTIAAMIPIAAMLSMFVNVFTQPASEYAMPQLETLLKRSGTPNVLIET